MKKSVVKAIAVSIALICLMSAFTFNSSAGNYSHNESQFTAETNTVGNSKAEFYGTGYSTFGIIAECQGGATGSFLTSLHVRYYNNVAIPQDEQTNSNTEGLRTLKREVVMDINTYSITGKGWAEFSCVSKTDSSDKWEELYQHQWVGGSTGWRDY